MSWIVLYRGRTMDSIGLCCTASSFEVFINESDPLCVKLCKIKLIDRMDLEK